MKKMQTPFLVLGILAFTSVTAAGLYEHVAMVPRWSAAPPVSLSMFKGPYGVNAGLFWRSIHPVTLVLLTIALILNWRSPRRRPVLVAYLSYIVVLALTFAFFVPELISIITTPISSASDAGLTARAGQWETLSLLRLGLMFVMSAVLLFSLTKPVSNISTSQV